MFNFFPFSLPLPPPFQRLGHAHHQNPWVLGFYIRYTNEKSARERNRGGGGIVKVKNIHVESNVVYLHFLKHGI